MAKNTILTFGTFVLLFDICEGYIRCGDFECFGSGSYCCDGQCCTYFWNIWWFWILWIVLFMVLTLCSLCCRRHYRRRQYVQSEYVIVNQANPVMYGTNAYGSVENPVLPCYTPQAQVPMAPPAYIPPEQKPPGYNTVAN